MSNNKKIIIVLIAFVSIFFGLESFPFRINTSTSLPYRIFLRKQKGEVKRHIYVSFSHPENTKPLVKQVVGLPGDHIEKREDHILVNGFDCGKVVSITKTGNRVTPLDCEVIPEGYLFVYASHPESFDSRYQEFGLVEIDKIEEELWPVF